MKHLFFTLILIMCIINSNGQQKFYKGFSVLTTQNALPFSRLGGLFSETVHPGFEILAGKSLQSNPGHDWYADINAGYFYHRFVQHAIPVYLSLGYRYKLKKHLSIQSSIGAGYMHSIPAVQKFKLNEEGEYDNNKGAGRMQAIALFDLGVGYALNKKGRTKLVVRWQQRIQMPFVRSYVPLLPYNSLLIGFIQTLKLK